MEVDATSEISILDYMLLMEGDTAVQEASTNNHNAEKSVPDCNFYRKKYELVGIVINLDKISGVQYPLKNVREKRKKILKALIKCNRFAYAKDVLIISLRITLNGDGKSIETLLVDDVVYKYSIPSIQVALVKQQHQLAALSELNSRKESYGRKPEADCKYLVIQKDGQPMTSCENAIIGRSCNTQIYQVWKDSESLVVLGTMLMLARTFQL